MALADRTITRLSESSWTHAIRALALAIPACSSARLVVASPSTTSDPASLAAAAASASCSITTTGTREASNCS